MGGIRGRRLDLEMIEWERGLLGKENDWEKGKFGKKNRLGKI